MVRINDTFEFEVYSWDTPQSIAERLAANENMKTLPKYLYFPIGEDPDISIPLLRKRDSMQVRDLLKDIRKLELSTILSTLDKLKFFIRKKLDIVTDIIAPYVAYSTALEEAPKELRGALILQLKSSITDRRITVQKLGEMWVDRNATKAAIDHAVEANKTKVREMQVLVSVKGLSHTKFRRHEVALRLEFDFRDLTLLEVFDKIKLTPKVPYASVNNLYKILRDFTPKPGWDAMEGHIYFKFRATPLVEVPDFFDVVLVVEGERGREKGILQTSPIKYRKGTTAEDFLHNLQEIFQPRLPLRISSSKVEKEKGRFYYRLGKSPIDSYVLGDLAFTDLLFNQYLAIDEHEAATKGKRSSTYIHFFGGGGNTQTVKANITVYRVRDKDIAHRRYKYPIGEYYLNVLVSDVRSSSDLEDFIILFGKLLRLYYTKAPQVIKTYQELLAPETFPPKYQPRKPPVKGKKNKIPLGRQAPEVFVAGYPTKCGNQPRIISAEEAKEEDKAVMLYPKTATEGFPQRWYVCDETPGFPYPGLRSNELSNSDIVPYLPCCFKTKQDLGPKGGEGRQPKPYDHYFYNVPLINRTSGGQLRPLIRDVFTDPPKVAVLPEQLEEMLNLITYRQGWSFVRAGVFDSKASFLECVLEAIQGYSGDVPHTKKMSKEIRKSLVYKSPKVRAAHKALSEATSESKVEAESKLWEAKKNERIQLLNDIREKLATPSNATGCSQEMYDYSEDEIIQTIRDPDTYFDPRLLTNLIERYFKCRIMLFSRVIPGRERGYQSSLNPVLTIPRHIQAYYKTQEDVPTILIYERLGRGGEQKEYPRCELMQYWDGKGHGTWLHDSTSRVSREMQVLYERVRESYNLNCLAVQTILPLDGFREIGIKFTHQEIDSYGKCRALVFDYKGQTGSLLVTPVQPLLLPRFNNTVTPRLSLESVQEIFTSLEIDIDKESITGHHVSGYSGRIGNVRFSLPFKQGDEIPPGKVPTERDLTSRDQAVSKLRAYTTDKRIARYMVEYARWLYSHFLSDKGLQDSTKNLQKFVKEHIRVDEEYQYGHVAKTFHMTSGMSKGGVLYVKSIETLKRLIYTLQLYALYHPRELEQYKSRVSISSYYLNVGDFTRYRSQVILQGDHAVTKWINERGQDYSLHDSVVTNSRVDKLKMYIENLSEQISALPAHKMEDKRERLIEDLEEAKTEYSQLYKTVLGTPHFFKNPLVEPNEIYLYQEATGLPQALKICTKWNRRGINNGQSINKSEKDDIPSEDFTLYSYQSPTKVESYLCNEGCKPGKKDGIKVLGYRDEVNDPIFISLLPLGPCRR